MKLAKLLGLTACMLVLSAGTALADSNTPTAVDGEWRQDDKGWWFVQSDGYWLRSQWALIDGNHDSIAEYYYFNEFGYILTNSPAPGAYSLNELGQWYKRINGEKVVQTVKVKTFKEGNVGGTYARGKNELSIGWFSDGGDTPLYADFIKNGEEENRATVQYAFKDSGNNTYTHTDEEGHFIKIDYNNRDKVIITSDIEKINIRFAGEYKKTEDLPEESN